jgi:glycosyltransferase involved in cell wall biosynthesis
VLKINWFSALPPARSGIAHYAMQVLPLLARNHEVVLWTDQDQVAPEVHKLARVALYDPGTPLPWREINKGTISFYHLGNQPDFHAGIWQVSTQQPGIVVLHDLCLHDFFFTLAVRRGKDRAAYLNAMERWYGQEGRRSAEAFCAGGVSAESMAQKFPLTQEAARNALGAITHCHGALEELHETPACPSTALDFPYAAAAESRYRAWQAVREGVPHPPYRLMVFGYLNRNRRLGPLLEALAGMPEREQFRLEICGQLWDESHIRDQIERLGLSSIVSLPGFLSGGQVEQKLSTAHLAINLRYPSMGEASLSQLQFWDYGLPTLVTRTGWYASLPEDAAAFVRPASEVADIQAQLRNFLADPGAFRAMGERGRWSLRNHDPQRYVDAMTHFAAEALRLSPRVSALALARRIGSDLREWLPAAASPYLLERASKEIYTIFEGRRRG